MARRVFFSFHYQRDIFRVNQIRNLPEIIGIAAAGFQDASLWEKTRKDGDAAIKRMIDDALDGTSVTVIFIGYQTANRKYVDYEIAQSLERVNGVIGVRIHHLRNQYQQTDLSGQIPLRMQLARSKIYSYLDPSSLAQWIEDAARLVGR